MPACVHNLTTIRNPTTMNNGIPLLMIVHTPRVQKVVDSLELHLAVSVFYAVFAAGT
jgi:hypothetical protein